MFNIKILLGSLLSLISCISIKTQDSLYSRELNLLLANPVVVLQSGDQSSGFIIEDSGEYYVLTVHHGIIDHINNNNNVIYVHLLSNLEDFHHRTPLKTELLIYDSTKDLALLKINNPLKLKLESIRLSPDCAMPNLYEDVYVIASPGGIPFIRTEGEVVSLCSDTNKFIFTGSIYFGSSGGGIYDRNSLKLIGMVQSIFGTFQNGVDMPFTFMGEGTSMINICEWLKSTDYKFLVK